MTNDIVALIDYYEKEKGIEREKVLAALQFAFISAYRKMVPGSDAIEEIRADVDMKKADTTIFATLRVIEDEDFSDNWNQVPLSTAQKKNPSAQVGDPIEFNVRSMMSSRIAQATSSVEQYVVLRRVMCG